MSTAFEDVCVEFYGAESKAGAENTAYAICRLVKMFGRKLWGTHPRKDLDPIFTRDLEVIQFSLR